MANTRRTWFRALNFSKCVAPGIGGLVQLQQRVHTGVLTRGRQDRVIGPERREPRPRRGDKGSTQPCSFALRLTLTRNCPSIAYWITTNQTIRSHMEEQQRTSVPTLPLGITATVLSFRGKFQKQDVWNFFPHHDEHPGLRLQVRWLLTKASEESVSTNQDQIQVFFCFCFSLN